MGRAISVHPSVPVVTAAVFTLLGCADPTVTAPARDTVVAMNAPAAALEARAALGAAVDDALSRILPTLPPTGETSEVLSAFKALRASVDASTSSLAKSGMRARHALDLLEGSFANDASVGAELSALGLVLDRVAELDP